MEFLEVPLFDDDFYKMVVRYAFNLIFAILLVTLVYSRRHHTTSYGFTFLMMNTMVFFICFALKKLELELGMALGLFAIFSVLRYRTDAMKIHDMTYLFILVGIAVINALSNRKTSYTELIFTNLIILAGCALLERFLCVGNMSSCLITTERIDLMGSQKESELREFIRTTTGLDVRSAHIEKADLKNAKIQVRVFHQRNRVQ
ncbi:MAG: DUF4956 domain-containing protein [Planctomycetota bacterium]|nr:DUF4956 domain-containing protein [Planctomycetota bacterium]